MDDPVLHRKVFREKALRVGALKPKRYQLGTGPMGIEGISTSPYYTTESQGQQLREFVKDGKRYIVDSRGQIVKTEYLPAVIEKKGGLEPKGKFYTTMEALLDPEKATERGTYKEIGEKAGKYGTQIKEFAQEGIASLKEKAKSGYGKTKEVIFNPQTYKTLGKGIGLGVLGYGGAQDIGEATGTENIVNPALATVGGAQILGELASKRLGYLAGPGRLLMNPYAALGLGTLGTAGKMIQSNYRELMSLPPEVRKQIGESTNQGEIVFENYALDPSKGGASTIAPYNVLPTGDGGTTGGGTTGGAPPSGGTPGIPPLGVTGPVISPTGENVNPLAVISDKQEPVAIKKEGEELKIDPKGNKKQKQDPVLASVFDRFGDFARSASGNAFLLKFAAGLLSGKGSFGEVVGNALNPAVDLFAAYKLKEDETALKQLESLAKLEGNADRMQGAVRITRQVQNPDGTMGTIVTSVPARRDKKTLQTYIVEGNRLVPVSQEVGQSFREYNPNAKDLSFALDGFANSSAAIAYIDFVEKAKLTNVGLPGKVKYNVYRGLGMLKGLVGLGEEMKADTPVAFGDDVKGAYTGKELQAAQDSFSRVTDNIEQMFARMPKEDKEYLAKMDVTSTTLRYYLANAFKQKDRLTQGDLNAIEKLTKILAYDDPETIKNKLGEIKKILTNKSVSYLEQARDAGYSDAEFVQRFLTSPASKVTLGFVGLNNPELFAATGSKENQSNVGQPIGNFQKLTTDQQLNLFKKYGFVQ